MNNANKRQLKKHYKRSIMIRSVPESKKSGRAKKKVSYWKRKRKVKKKIIILNIMCEQGPPGRPGKQGPPGPPGISSVRIIPNVRRYFFAADTNIDLSDTPMISSNRFINDDGELVNEFVDLGEEGYYNLYVNAVLQEGKIYNVNRNALIINSNDEVIYAGTLIILEAVGFTVKLIH